MPLSLDQFVRQLNDSGLVQADELAALRAHSSAKTAEQLARELVKQKKLTAFQAQQIYSGRGKSLLLGNYMLLDKIGQGGMGLVFKAQHRRMMRTVALKVLSPSVTRNPTLVARFQREVHLAARLEHPNIVSAFDADEAAGTFFLVMQYVDGLDLSTLVKKKGPLPLEQAVNCVLQAAQGLEYAHQQGIIHRDIKPANLLLDGEGTVKILDMGLARLEGDTAGQAELTNTGAVMGTVDYMAPEQALSTKAADNRSDVYSLGIALWYLVVGRPAYTGDSLMARMLAHRESPIPSLAATLRPKNGGPPARLLEAVDAVFQKMVAKKPEQRHQTMGEVVDALEACLRGEAPVPKLTAAVASEDSKFSGFLSGLSNSDPTLPSSGGSAGSGSSPFAELEATAAASSSSSPTDPSGSPSRSAVRSRSLRRNAFWHDRRVQAGAVGVLLLALAAPIVLRPRSAGLVPASETIIAGPAPSLPKAKTTSLENDDVSMSPLGVPTFFGNPTASLKLPVRTGPWTDLFNGQDLTGWTPQGYDGWKTENGVLIGETSGRNVGWLMTDAEFTDFEFDLEFKLAADANSGVFLRAWPEGNVNGSEFLEVQLIDEDSPANSNLSPKAKTGALYGKVVTKASAKAPANNWNRLQVWLFGKHLKVGVNSVEVLDTHDIQRTEPGRIGLQLYPTRVEFRNLRVRTFSPR